ncbi:MAG: 1-acyl-sn-glycerol-3-phosphate acyltransferase [Myxococcota bacterium]
MWSEIGAVAGGIVAWEALRALTIRALRRRWQRSIGDFLRRHSVQLEQFRFIDRVWVRQTLLQDPVIDRLAAERATERACPMIDVRAQIEEYLDEIVPYFNLFSYYKLGAAMARTAVGFCYELVFDGPALERARAAVPAGAVTVYVSNHRSNADYVVLSVGAMRQVALSYAVGEWARVWPLDALFRSFGSYFVRRGEKDPLYHRVLERYLQLVASRGLTTAFFLEGALSRDGGLRQPKIGLLDYLVGILREEPDRRIVFVPVGINFDRVLEDRNLLASAAGPPRLRQKLASLAQILSRAPSLAASIFARAALRAHRKYGYAAVSFGAPIPIEAAMPDAAAVARLPPEERRPKIAALADHLLAEVAKVVPATPVTLACRAIDAGAGDVAAVRRHVRDELAALRAAGRPVAEGRAWDGIHAARRRREDSADKASLDRDILEAEESELTVDLALRLLARRGVVRVADGRVVTTPGDEDVVRYYARSLDPPRQSAVRREAAASG